MTTKVLKRLETNKIRGGFHDKPKTVLVPVSFGISSICLLHLLDQQIRSRNEQGRHAGYNLHVLIIDQSALFGISFPEDLAALLKQRFPSYIHTIISIEDCSKYGVEFDEITADEDKGLSHTVASFSSPTSKLDFIEIARRRLIFAYAQRHSCDSVLFGDSTTRLAEKTLSATSKGRGGALPWITADSTASGGINCIYPMRDLLKKEIAAYAATISPTLMTLIARQSDQVYASTKDMTIDGLMSRYFESIEHTYPSIVANVVRTSDKLVAPNSNEVTATCSMCSLPVQTEPWGGEQQVARSVHTQDHGRLCYGCTRAISKS